MSHRIFVPVSYYIIKINTCFSVFKPAHWYFGLERVSTIWNLKRQIDLYLFNAKGGVEFLRKILEQGPEFIPSSNLSFCKKMFWLIFQRGKSRDQSVKSLLGHRIELES